MMLVMKKDHSSRRTRHRGREAASRVAKINVICAARTDNALGPGPNPRPVALTVVQRMPTAGVELTCRRAAGAVARKRRAGRGAVTRPRHLRRGGGEGRDAIAPKIR